MLCSKRLLRPSALSVLVLAAAAIGRAQSITEYPVPSASQHPGAITTGPDGNLWFTEGPVGAIGRITPDGVITEFPLPTPDYVGANIVVGPDGNLWFTEQAVHTHAGKIGRVSTAGEIAEFATSGEGYPLGIALGPDGNVWFTDLLGTIARITPSGVITVVSPTGAVDAGNSITSGPDGNLWFTGTLSNTIGRITPAGVVTTFPIPTAHVGPNQITAGADGNLWFTEDGGGIGRITTAGVVTEFQPPTAHNFANGITAGPDGRIWFTESGGPGGSGVGKVGKVTPSGEITEIDLPIAGSGPSGITVGPDGKIWVAELQAGNIARIDPEGPCNTHGTTLCLGGGRFQVRAHWEIPDKGESGEGNAVSLTPDSGYFWFFSPSNVELVVKVLNACSGNGGRFWVFAGGLTNVGVTLTVTDVQTKAVQSYVNPAGTPFAPIQDTSAFSTCP